MASVFFPMELWPYVAGSGGLHTLFSLSCTAQGNADLRRSAAAVIPLAREQVASLQSKDHGDVAVGILVNLGEFAAPAIVPALTHKDAHVRAGAARVFGFLGEAAAPYAKELAYLLLDSNSLVQLEAKTALISIGDAAIPHVAAHLRAERVSTKLAALEVLGALQTAATPHAAKLATMLRDETPSVRKGAMQVLGKLGEPAVPYAAALLQDEEPEIRLAAIGVLEMLGKAAEPHVTEIAFLLEDENLHIRSAAKQCMKAVVGPADSS